MNRFFATIILLATAISLTAAAASWIITTYRSMTWKPEILRVLDTKMYRDDNENAWILKIYVENIGEGIAEIYKVEIHGIETINLNPSEKVYPSERKEVKIKLGKEYSYGTTYTIRLYLKSGSIYPVLERVVKT